MSELVTLKPEVMIEIMRKQLKDELRKELMQELNPVSYEKPWKKVKKHVDEKLSSYNSYNQYQIQQAIYTIIRYSLDINKVLDLQEEQVEHANLIVDKIIEMLFPTELTSNGK
ncbi:MAG: hypothetical protein K0R18_1663 [Bacillales bacterium]|jgi:hypothetical protein|nr:hypothetical protein [Bacillales bacterium]